MYKYKKIQQCGFRGFLPSVLFRRFDTNSNACPEFNRAEMSTASQQSAYFPRVSPLTGGEQQENWETSLSRCSPAAVPLRKQSPPFRDRSPPKWGCARNDHAIEWRARHACLPPPLLCAISGSVFCNPPGYCTALDGSAIAVPFALNGRPDRGKTGGESAASPPLDQRSASASQWGGECLAFFFFFCRCVGASCRGVWWWSGGGGSGDQIGLADAGRLKFLG